MKKPARVVTFLLATLAAGAFIAIVREAMTSDAAAQTKKATSGKGRFPPIEKRMRPILTKALAEKGFRYGAPIFLRAFKKDGEVELWIESEKTKRFVLFKTYRVTAASGSLGPKIKEGDRQVPEGFYFVTKGALNPWSKYHLSFDIGYPNAFDRHHKRTGGLIMIHGNQVSLGCLAMGDAAIEEIYTLGAAALENGQRFFRVHIFPFRLSDGNMAEARRLYGEKWLPFWENLKEGYDWFEKRRQTPDANIDRKTGRYTFSE